MTNVYKILTNVDKILTNVDKILTNVDKILTNVDDCHLLAEVSPAWSSFPRVMACPVSRQYLSVKVWKWKSFKSSSFMFDRIFCLMKGFFYFIPFCSVNIPSKSSSDLFIFWMIHIWHPYKVNCFLIEIFYHNNRNYCILRNNLDEHLVSCWGEGGQIYIILSVYCACDVPLLKYWRLEKVKPVIFYTIYSLLQIFSRQSSSTSTFVSQS